MFVANLGESARFSVVRLSLQNRFFCFLVALPILYFLSVSLLFVCLCVFACVCVCVHTHTPCSVFCDRSFFVATARFSLLCVSTSTFILIVFPFFFQSRAIGG